MTVGKGVCIPLRKMLPAVISDEVVKGVEFSIFSSDLKSELGCSSFCTDVFGPDKYDATKAMLSVSCEQTGAPSISICGAIAPSIGIELTGLWHLNFSYQSIKEHVRWFRSSFLFTYLSSPSSKRS